MRVKFTAPNILPGDYVTADLMAVPSKGDTVLVYDEKADTEELLTVKSVVWPISPSSEIRHYAHADMPEIVCERAEDVGESCCCRFLAGDECCGPCSTNRHRSCVGPLTPLERTVTHGH